MNKVVQFSMIAAALALPAAAAAQVLDANPPPPNNGGSTGWALFFDLEARTPVSVIQVVTGNTGSAGTQFQVEVFVREGSALAGGAGGAGSSSAGWTSLGTAPAVQGAAGSSGVSEPIDIPPIDVEPGRITGVALLFTGAGPRYFGTGTPPHQVFQDANLTLTTGDSRSAPFTTGGSFFSSRGLVGSLTYRAGTAVCYPDCDGNEVLDFFDFLCFQNAFLAGDPYADCDGNTVLDFFDFLCFQNEFLAGCP